MTGLSECRFGEDCGTAMLGWTSVAAGPAAWSVGSGAGAGRPRRQRGDRVWWAAGTLRATARPPRPAWPAAPAGHAAGDRRGGGADRCPLVRRDRAVLPHPPAGDAGAAGDLQAALVYLACRAQRDDPALGAAAGGRRRAGPDRGRLAGRAGRRRAVAATTNQTTQLAPLLDGVDLAGRVVTADALHTTPAQARYLIGRDADSVLTVKGNQPGLVTAIDRLAPEVFSPGAHHR